MKKELKPIIFKRAADRMNIDEGSMWAAIDFAANNDEKLYDECYNFIRENLINPTEETDWGFKEFTLAKQIFLDLCALILKDEKNKWYY